MARGALGTDAGAFVVAMLGGWWWAWKDNDTVVAACAGSTGRSGERPTGVEMRRSYAASSVTVVSRRPGVGTESGLVMDAARYGVPLICSDHDPDLLRRLAGQSWARTFAAGDPADLAAVLDDASVHPPARPGRGAARRMGLRNGAGLLSFYDDLANRIGA